MARQRRAMSDRNDFNANLIAALFEWHRFDSGRVHAIGGALPLVPIVLVARINIFVTDNVVLAQIGAGLYLDKNHRQHTGILHPVHSSKWNID